MSKNKITVELTNEEAQLMLNMVRGQPIQGTLLTLPAMLKRLTSIQEKLIAEMGMMEGNENEGSEELR